MLLFFKLFLLLFVFVAMSQQKSAFHITAVCQSVPFSCSGLLTRHQIGPVKTHKRGSVGEECVVEPNSGAQTVCSLSLSSRKTQNSRDK